MKGKKATKATNAPIEVAKPVEDKVVHKEATVAPVNETTEANTVEPPYSIKISRKRTFVKVNITLHRIPHNCINYEPTKTHVYLDTLKYSKKYLLNVPYPEGIAVDLEKAETAQLEYGILSQNIPIVQAGGESKTEFVKQQSPVKKGGKAAQQQKKQPTPASAAKRPAKTEKRKLSKDDSDDGDKRQQPALKKKKTLVSDKESSLEILSSVVSNTSSKKTQKLNELDAKVKKVEEIEKKRDERKQKKMEKKQRFMDEVMENMKKKKKPEKKAPTTEKRRKVSFQ